MSDPRVTKLAKVLVHYSIAAKPKEQVLLRTNPYAEELTLAVYEELIKAGSFPYIVNEVPGSQEIFFKYANDDQLDYISPVTKMLFETYDASINLWSDYNTRRLSGADNAKIARTRRASSPLMKTSMQRTAAGEFRWVLTAYPTHAMAQEADMSLDDYREFVYGAGLLNDDDPVSLWKAEGAKQQKLIQWLKGHDKAALKGSNVDITL
jgi:aminopeptidase